jgi:hypothetical protein
MILNVFAGGDEPTPVNVPDNILFEAEAFFKKMDADLDKGWQMSRDWVEQLNTLQRCQVAADRLLTALENENRAMATMMAGYILNKMPGIKEIHIDTTGDMQQTEILMK